MPDQHFNIIFEVIGGQVAETRIEGIAGAEQNVGNQATTAEKKSGGFMKTLGKLAVAFGAFKTVAFFKDAIDETAGLARATAGLQRITGQDTKTASGWVATANERGLSSKALNISMVTMSRQILAAEKGSKSAIGTFRSLGIAQGDLAKLNTDQVLGRVSDAFKRLPAGVVRSAAAQKLFGRASQTMLGLLSGGSKVVDEQVGSMGKLLGFTDKQVKGSVDLFKQQRELNKTMLGFKVAIGSALIPVLLQLSRVFLPILQTFAKLVQSSPAFRVAIFGLAIAFGAVVLALSPLWGLEGAIAAGIALVVIGFTTLWNRCKLFRDVVTAVWTWIKTHWPLLLLIMAPFVWLIVQIVRHFNDIKGAAVGAFNTVKNAATTAVKWVTDRFNGLVGFVKSLPGRIARAAVGIWDGLKGGAVAIINWIIEKFNGLPFIHGFSVLGFHTPGIPRVAPISTAQHGGFMPGGMALVGERGPEVVSLPAGAFVHPTGTGPAGGGVSHVHHIYLDGHRIMTALGDVAATRQAAR